MKKTLFAFIAFSILVLLMVQVLRHPLVENQIVKQQKAWVEKQKAQDKIRKLIALSKKGNANSPNWLGNIYYNGYNGVTVSYNKALKWYKRGAKKGNDRSQMQLGYMYYHGKGVSKDLAQAIKWYEQAAKQGNKNAQRNLGSVYYEIGKQKRLKTQSYAEAVRAHVRAYGWFHISKHKKAAKHNKYRGKILNFDKFDPVDKHMETLALELTHQDLTKAQRAAVKCFSKSNYKNCALYN